MAAGKPTGEQLPIFIGDELSALGYRRAGARVIVPGDDLLEAFERACGEAPVVVITAELAARLPARRLGQARLALQPVVLVVPDVQNRSPMPDAGERVRRQLGMET
jgi:vacuolar-type H+-ATPase subunit F/Vma7